MNAIRIAHISDLHFDAKGRHLETWGALKDHLQQDIRPNLVLVTGDIVETPNPRLYEDARNALDALCAGIRNDTRVEYYVCPGNHDRFPSGNAPFFLKKTGWIRRWLRRSAAEFNLCFQGHIPTLAAPIDLDLGSPGNNWTIRLLGLDSSIETDASARGFISRSEINALDAAMEHADDVDISVLLVHHHLLPVRVLERAREGNWRDLASVTPLVNAGSLVEALAAAHVDLALHGHEHAENWGRYATCESGGGETNIVGAGSATGTVTLKPCDPNKASYNLIELRNDRTVRLCINKFDGARGRWHSGGREFDIYDSQALRRVRFMRRGRGNIYRPPNSDVTKYFEFTRERDGIIREVRTRIDFSRQPYLAITPTNTTGFPTDLEIVLTDDQGNVWRPKEDLVFNIGDRGNFYFRCPIPEEVAKVPQRVDISYRWFCGAVLTAEELNAIDPGRRGEFRSRGWEFAVIPVDTYYSSLRLIVSIPEEFAPPAEDVAAFFQSPRAQEAGDSFLQPDVTSGLRIIGDGLYSLVIPYPRIGFLYGIKWRLPRETSTLASNGGAAFQFASAARSSGPMLAKAFYDGLNGTPLATRSQVSIYVPSANGAHSLELVGAHPSGASAPLAVRMADEASLVTQAWRGAPAVALRLPEDGSTEPWWDVGFTPDERALIALPVRFSVTWTNDSPWGVVRISICELGTASSLLDPMNGAQLLRCLMRPMILMLAAADVGML